MEITITGEANTLVAPELARLHLNVSFSDRDKARALQSTQSRANGIVAELEALPCEILDDFVVGGVTTYSHRPWDGKSRRPTTHVASCAITAIFKDFSALAEASAAWGELEGVDVGHTSWQLTDATREQALAALIGEALDAARTKALLIAGHLGDADVEVVKVSDRSVDSPPVERAFFAAAEGVRGAAAPVEARPEDIRLQTSLTVLFATN